MHESTRIRLEEMKARRKGRTFKVSRVPRAVAAQSFKGVIETSQVGSFLAASISWITGIKGDKSCGCANLASQMNKRGPDWCEKQADHIIGKMMSNKDKLAEAVKVPAAVLNSVFGVMAVEAGARVLLWNAIRKDRARAVKKKRVGVARHRSRSVERKARRADPPVVRAALPNDVRKNLIYHIYPVKRQRWLWQWNLDQILKRIDLFNGRRIVGIVCDDSTDPAEMVKEYLQGHGFEFIVEENDRGRGGRKSLGENVTAVKLMQAVQSFEPEVTFRAHAKGVTKRFGKPLSDRTENGETVKKWTEIMYAVCLDDWPTVRGQLEEFAMSGPFRKLKKLSGAAWYYSGSFYWYEHIRFYQRNWQDLEPRRTGVESLPGRLFKTSEVGCLHGDDCGSLYHHTYMRDEVWPAFVEWKTGR